MALWNRKKETDQETGSENMSDQIDEQNEQIEEVDSDASDMEDTHETDWKMEYTQLMSEFDNFRKRTRKDIESAQMKEKIAILRPILDSLDNFERAFSLEDAEDSPWASGVKGSYEHLMQTVESFGVEPIKALYEPFNPDLHEAIGCQESDKLAPETIAEVIQKGYQLKNGPVIRYARVIVVS